MAATYWGQQQLFNFCGGLNKNGPPLSLRGGTLKRCDLVGRNLVVQALRSHILKYSS